MAENASSREKVRPKKNFLVKFFKSSKRQETPTTIENSVFFSDFEQIYENLVIFSKIPYIFDFEIGFWSDGWNFF